MSYNPGDIFKKELNNECWVWVLLSKDKQDWSEDVPVWTAAKFYTFGNEQSTDMFGAQVSYLYDSDIAGMEPIGTIKSLVKTIPSMSS